MQEIQSIPVSEYWEWVAFYLLEEEAQKEAEMKAKVRAKTEHRTPRGFG